MVRASGCLRGSVYALVSVAGLLFLSSIALAGLRLHGTLSLKWWLVLLPTGVALGLGLLVLTVAVGMWVRMAFKLLTGEPLEVEEGSGEVSLDVIFSTAKTCLLGHGFVLLFFSAFVLLEVKLRWYEQEPQKAMPALYPLLLLVVLGTLHLIVAYFFKRPEIDSRWSMVASATLLSQSIMLILKLDYFYDHEHFYWALTFLPSWFAYASIFVFCVYYGVSSVVEQVQARAAQSRLRATCPPWQAANDGGSGGTSAEDGKARSCTPTGEQADKLSDSPWPEEQRCSSRMVIALALWGMGNCASQVMLALRLDTLARLPWLVVLIPAACSWTLLVIFGVEPASEYLLEMRLRLLQPCVGPPVSSGGERAPLLPWRNNY